MKNMKKMMAIVIATMMIAMYAVVPSFAAYSYEQVASGATYDASASYFTDAEGTNAYTGGADGFEDAIASGLYIRSGSPDETPSGGGDSGSGGSTPAANDQFGHGTFSATAEDEVIATGVTSGDTVSIYQLVEWKDGDWALTTLGETAGVTLANLVDGISEAEATTIAKALASASATKTMTETATAGTYNAQPVNPGLYYVKAVPAANNKDTVYNPAFVSADYYSGNNTVDFSDTIGSSTVVKKSGVPFDKEVTGSDQFIDTKPGDVIPYKITTEIPSYGTTFENPVFTISDTLSEGLALEGDVSVKYGDNAAVTETQTNIVTITKKTNGFTVEFAKDYLRGLNGATPAVEITYSAKVTTEALNNVTYMDNKAKLTFSNSPTTTKDQDDITRHYTFTIDGNLLGQTGVPGSELIKRGVDSEGNPIQELVKKTYHETEVGVLPGAKFSLVGKAGTPTAGVSKTATSGTNGHITFTGLDAGVYELTETSAPDGYIKSNKTYTVTITPHYNSTTPDLLDSYDITFDDGTNSGTASFTMTNEKPSADDIFVETTESGPESGTSFVDNTQGTELPSTGGIGTTLFYLIGAILVIGAGVVLITRRRMSAHEE